MVTKLFHVHIFLPSLSKSPAEEEKGEVEEGEERGVSISSALDPY